MSVTIGIDVGGTFTDLYWSDGTSEGIVKVSSTPADPAGGLLNALTRSRFDAKDIAALLHGSTVATNAIIERKGARCGLITTEGFRDILEMGRRDRPSMYGLTGVQRPLIPRDRRWEVRERIDHRGNVLTPLDESGVWTVAQAMLDQNVEAVVVSLFHSYANPQHEQRVRDILRSVKPDWTIVLSTDVLCEYYEFERTSTAAVQGFLEPLIVRYRDGLAQRLTNYGFTRDTLVMQSNGGLVSANQLADRAAHLVQSGPAAGVSAAARIAANAGFDRVILADVGGTSCDVCVVIDGRPEVADTSSLDFRVPLHLPMINVQSIGAGGGSIAWIDRGGILQVGPQSAGAVPGPVLYGKGGTLPTVTDANAVLGRINVDKPIGVDHVFDVAGSRKVIAALAEQLKLSVEETAEAILAVVNQNMAARIRLMSVEKGHDPREFGLIAFGGGGPLHGAVLMREVGIGTLIVPPYPGVLCAMGCALADLRYDYSQTVNQALEDARLGQLQETMRHHEMQGRARLERDAVTFAEIKVEHFAEMNFRGQLHTLRIPISRDWQFDQWADAFRSAYQAEFGSLLDDLSVVVVTLRTTVVGVRLRTPAAPKTLVTDKAVPRQTRKVYFGRWRDTPIYHRQDLQPGMSFAGPAIVEQADTTVVIEDGQIASVDPFDNLLVREA